MSQTENGYTNDTPLPELETNLDLLEDYWTQFQSVQLAIQATCREIDMQIIEMVDAENVYRSTESKIRGFIKRYTDQQQQGAGGQQGAGSQLGAGVLPFTFLFKVPDSSTVTCP